MKRFLILLLAALTLPTAIYPGIPDNKLGKWVRINKNWMIDTEDVEVKKGKLRFYMLRNAAKGDFTGSTQFRNDYTAKVRINCDDFTAGIQAKVEGGLLGPSYGRSQKMKLFKEHVGYGLAKYFCFATGSEGYTREDTEPEWVVKIINNIEIRKIDKKNKLGNINCDSPVWKKKPICN